MAKFFGYLKGNRGETSRCGSKTSGIRTMVTGWDFGCHVEMNYNPDKDEDIIKIKITDGTNGCKTLKTLEFKKSDLCN